jgi:protein TonB
MALLRILLSLVLAAGVTFGLLFTMQYLIATADRSLDEDAAGHMVDFVRVKRDEQIKRKQRKPEKPPQPKQPPPEPPPPEMDDATPEAEKLSVAAIDVDTDINMTSGGISLTPGDAEYLPIVKVAPVYPRRALQRGIEGWVLLEFTVSKQGTVKDIRVVDSEPKSKIFHRAAVKAAAKFKYKPRTEDGKPIEVPGVRNRIVFRMEK